MLRYIRIYPETGTLRDPMANQESVIVKKYGSCSAIVWAQFSRSYELVLLMLVLESSMIYLFIICGPIQV